MYTQVLAPVGGSLGWSALVAAAPLTALFALLGMFRVQAWLASLVSLAAALAVALLAYGMPPVQALLATGEGAAFGVWPILWIVVNALWIYNMTVHTGHFAVLRRSFTRVSSDQRIQALLIAFCFGAVLEALAGFGTPVAISSVMLITLGFRPLRAATLALVANTVPVAFGGLALPIVTLSKISGVPEQALGEMVGRQTSLLSLLVPLALVFIADGLRGLRQTWPAALVTGASFGFAQFATSNYFSVALTDIVASLLAAACLVGLLRVWQPKTTGAPDPAAAAPEPSGGPGTAAREDVEPVADSRRDVLRAYAPYLLIVAIFVLAQIGAVDALLDEATLKFPWPGLHVLSPTGQASTLTTFKLDLLTNPGTMLFAAGLATALTLRVGATASLRTYGSTVRQLHQAIVTVMAVLALAFVLNTSGQTTTLGTFMAQAGGSFALLSPLLGWLGTAVTGSDASSNSLFGGLQAIAAHRAGLDPTLIVASNSSGGVLGKMVSPQNLTIGASAVALAGSEGELFRRVLGWTLLFLVGLCTLVYLQSTPVLSWMVPAA